MSTMNTERIFLSSIIFCTYILNIVCKVSSNSLVYTLNIIIDVFNLTKSTKFQNAKLFEKMVSVI